MVLFLYFFYVKEKKNMNMSLGNGEIFIDGKPFGATIGDAISFEDGEIPEYMSDVYVPLSANAELDFECEINPFVFEKITGVDLAMNYDLSAGFICKEPYQEQIRRHRKKRINKKWAKRYGYRTKFRDIKIQEVSLVNKDEGLFEFEGRYIHG